VQSSRTADTVTDLSTDRRGGPATQCMWLIDLCAMIYQLSMAWHVSHGCVWWLFVRPVSNSCMSSAPFAMRVQGSSLTLRLLHGTRTAEAIAATSTASQIRLAEVFASAIAEHAGIVAASAIFSIGHVSGARLAQHLSFSDGIARCKLHACWLSEQVSRQVQDTASCDWLCGWPSACPQPQHAPCTCLY